MNDFTTNSIDKQSELSELGQKALSEFTLTELYLEAISLINRHLPIEDCCLWQLLSDSNTLRLLAKQKATLEGKSTDIDSRELPWLQSVLKSGKIAVITGNSEQLPLTQPQQRRGLCVPISAAKQALGILEILTPNPHTWLKEDLNFVQSVVQILATAIQRKRSESLLQTQTQILEYVATGKGLDDILNCICTLIEAQSRGTVCSILLKDPSKQELRMGAGPSLSSEVAIAFDHLLIAENVGSCGTAAFRGVAVYVEDTFKDPVWADFREFARQHNIRACWSMPFFSQLGELLGTFALTHQVPCAPTDHHLSIIKTATHLASIALEGHRTAEQLKHKALFDELTGLPSRDYFIEELQYKLHQLQQHRLAEYSVSYDPCHFAVLFLDVDHFKLVNDSLGHSVGDQLLVALARQLSESLRSHDLLARLGGDEFAVLLDGVDNHQEAHEIVQRIQRSLAKPLQVDHQEVFTSVSIGMTHSSNSYEHTEELLRDADTAMYQAKDQGQGGYVVFDEVMHKQVRSRLWLGNSLRYAVKALEKGQCQFQLQYQPIFCLQQRKLIGFEALLRWHHPQQGLISPEQFIPIAEETGLIVPLGQWVLERACQQLAIWFEEFWAPVSMSINVSSQQFLQPDFVSSIQSLLNGHQLPGELLKLEITESVLMETTHHVTDRLEQLQKLGLLLSLDDFGTGYSSLNYLHNLPINTLKIDRSFVWGIGQGQDQIVKTIIALAHGLEMNVVAEGIETVEQAQYLNLLGCELGQGFWFARPLEPDDAKKWLLTLKNHRKLLT
ncbi:bifunctional diguanylate cyclase/phosphodiesterase [Acaryochloris marina]|uniref:Diguanylate cyclase/phosphodiesterase with PAS/PAC and GAF sensor n=1 Tax=Acaryochloris marina (strain MBIC 11017) TaxID=329726 RepID=B0C0K7_ACAM1|nr:EAL domain-containing protein [Acaryochloris marina]ABW30800.1 diguanylate cyclase/phosphodiesterase with PAS/PAC and GAF sensor [Acaryochloris marina MBIC11017]BDM79555.1 bifunctional diguanylate cyclase/phosphodiesterase [Acaryochloris marina MBIC10699]